VQLLVDGGFKRDGHSLGKGQHLQSVGLTDRQTRVDDLLLDSRLDLQGVLDALLAAHNLSLGVELERERCAYSSILHCNRSSDLSSRMRISEMY